MTPHPNYTACKALTFLTPMLAHHCRMQPYDSTGKHETTAAASIGQDTPSH